jgi:hypothetical protein
MPFFGNVQIAVGIAAQRALKFRVPFFAARRRNDAFRIFVQTFFRLPVFFRLRCSARRISA